MHARDEEAECVHEQVGSYEAEGEEGVEADVCSMESLVAVRNEEQEGNGAEADMEYESDGTHPSSNHV